MHSLYSTLALASGLFSSLFVHAAPPIQFGTEELVSRASTCNTPSNRACWTSGFNISTDYEISTPVTGVTRTYNLEITEIPNWVGPDGQVKELAMLINNQYPGPVITADWGDRINITVTNKLKTNGTSIHWHGIRQLNTNLQDGANGVTECPIPPNGGSKTYSFIAHQYGTTWYHSHFSAQYANGVVGTIIINGPASLPYDIDLGTFPISDYYLKTSDELVEITKNAGPPPSDNVLFNGTNINPATGKGKYANVTLTPGKRHRLRIINTSAENHFVLSLANHTMTVIESDFVPVNAETVDNLFVGIGQRYDVTIDASQKVSNYWFNVSYVPGGACGSSVNPAPAAIFHYSGAPGGNPTNAGPAVAVPTTCTDLANLSPVVTRTVSTSGVSFNQADTINVTLDFQPTSTTQVFTWLVNGSAINVDWDMPVDEYIFTGNTSYPRSENIVQVNTQNQWTFWLITNDPTFGIPHPIHLHGHDFLVLGKSDPNASGLQTFNPSTDIAKLNTNNPVRRDVTMLPALGWLVIAFKSDNPGSWLMHCHIAWHVSGGLSVDFLENPTQFKAGVSPADQAAFNDNCAKWRAYYPQNDPFKQQDSGLKMF